MRNLIIVSIIFLGFASYTCKSKLSDGARILEVNEFNVDDFLVDPGALLISDSLLLIETLLDTSKVHLVHVPSMDYLGGYLKQGKGPNEFLSAELGSSIYWGSVLFNDMAQRRFFIANVGDVVNNKSSFSHENKYIYDYSIPSVHDLSQIDSTRFVGSTVNGTGRFFIWNFETDSIKHIPFYPEFERSFESNQLSYVYYNWLSVNTKLQRIVSAYYHIGQFDIFDFYGELVKSIPINGKVLEPEMFHDNARFFTDETKFFVKDLATTDKFIYILYDGRIKINRNNGASSLVIKYDWSGNLIDKFQLKIPVNYIAVDQNDKHIYGSVTEASQIVYGSLEESLVKLTADLIVQELKDKDETDLK